MTVVVNLFGGPGSGKSTVCAGLFYHLKQAGVSCEMAREFAKEAVWEGRTSLFEDIKHQQYLFAKQLKRLQDLDGKVDIILSDSPLILSLIYGKTAKPYFHDYIKAAWGEFENFNVFLNRNKVYDELGRYQTEDEAKNLDREIRAMLLRDSTPYMTLTPDATVIPELAEYLRVSFAA